MKTLRQLNESKNRPIVSISPEQTVLRALEIMAEHDVGALLVLDGDRLAGVFSERDYARKVILIGKASQATAVKDIMTPFKKLHTVKPETSAEECMVIMTGKHIRHLPVFDGQALVGIVSIGDVVKAIISEQESLLSQLSDFVVGKYA